MTGTTITSSMVIAGLAFEPKEEDFRPMTVAEADKALRLSWQLFTNRPLAGRRLLGLPRKLTLRASLAAWRCCSLFEWPHPLSAPSPLRVVQKSSFVPE
jgi:hypothetical protein